MEIDVSLTVDLTRPHKIIDKTAIVIDVLRATSTIVTALSNGCRTIVPVESPAEALNVLKRTSEDNTLLGGETEAKISDGFNLGNSPYEYSSNIVSGKKIIFTTTNGTKAIKKSFSAKNTLIGCLLNAQATAYNAFKSGRNIHIICAGTRGKFSLEDTIAAGIIIDNFTRLTHAVTLTDIARSAHHIYLTYRNSLLYPLQNSTNGQKLSKLGFGSDILHCAQLNKYNAVPRCLNGVITI